MSRRSSSKDPSHLTHWELLRAQFMKFADALKKIFGLEEDEESWLPPCCEKVTSPIAGYVSFGLETEFILSSSVPTWLEGYFIRYGPTSAHDHIDRASLHECQFKEGPGLLQKFEFENGEILYSSRVIQVESPAWNHKDHHNHHHHPHNDKNHHEVHHEHPTVLIPDPCHVIFNRLSATFTGNLDIDDEMAAANISIHPVGGYIFTMEEAGVAHRIELENLERTMEVNFKHECGLMNLVTHPQVFEAEKKVYTIGQRLDILRMPQYVILEMDADTTQPGVSPWSNAKLLATIPSRWLTKVSYMHTFAMTQNYFIVIEQPVCRFFPEVCFLNLAQHPIKMMSSLFFPKRSTRFHVIARDGSGVRRIYRYQGFFFMHIINSYETWLGDIKVDICCYMDPKWVKQLYMKDPKRSLAEEEEFAQGFCSRPYRFNLIKKVKEVDGVAPAYKELLADFGVELPKINENFNTKMYKYFYGISSDIHSPHAGSLVKVNAELGTVIVWREPGARSYAGEPVFVPNPGAYEEDDGIVLATLVYGGDDPKYMDRTSVAILGAKKMELLAQVDFTLGSHVPNCSHGWFLHRKGQKEEEEEN